MTTRLTTRRSCPGRRGSPAPERGAVARRAPLLAPLALLAACAHDDPTGPGAEPPTEPPLLSTAAQVSASAANGKIAFVSNRDGNNEIYVMNADGSGVTRITNDAAIDEHPAWSPGGSKIAFRSDRDDPSGSYEVYVMNADGSGQMNLTKNGSFDDQPAWSPDGSKIAFASNRDGNLEIHVMNADGSGVNRLTNNAAFDVEPAWSPDGSKLAFRSSRDAGNNEIYVMNADGSGQTNLTNNDTGSDFNPAWAVPVGRQPQPQAITFTSTPPSPALVGGTYQVSATGGGSGNPVTFSSLTSGTCTVSGSTVSLLAAGTCTVAADQAGGSGFAAAPQATQSFSITITKAAQAISFTSTPPSPAYVGATYAVSATGGGSGNPVVFSSLSPGVCTLSGSTVSLVAAGSCVVAADQAGNATHNPAPQATQSFSVTKAAQAISFTSTPPDPALVGGTYQASAMGGASGNPVVFSSLTPSVCTVAGSTVSLAAVGTCTVAADQAGNEAYEPAPQVTQSFSVAAAGLTADIRILPGTAQLPLRLGDRRQTAISVTVFTTGSVNAAQIARVSLTLGDEQGTDTPVATSRGRPLATVVDVDRDGDRDLVAVFSKEQLKGNRDLTAATTELVLLGALIDGRQLRGASAVRVVP